MAISPNSILHFTKRRASLEKILEGFFTTHYCKEVFELNEAKYKLGIPMISFCDIPISNITSHTDKYGNYGIGLKKEWAELNRINPVLYMEKESSIAKLIEPLIREVIVNDKYGSFRTSLIEERNGDIVTIKPINDKDRELKINSVIGQLSFIKNYKGVLKRKGKPDILDYKFYDEREWRYVPVASEISDGHKYYDSIISEAEYDIWRGERLSKKKNIEGTELRFESKDIDYIFVKKESEIPTIIKAIRKSKNIYKNNEELDLLISKVLSLERIKNDF